MELEYQCLKSMKPSFGSAYLDDNITQFNTIHCTYSFHVINKGYLINRGHYLKKIVINIRASKNISGLVSNFFLMSSPDICFLYFFSYLPFIRVCFDKGVLCFFFTAWFLEENFIHIIKPNVWSERYMKLKMVISDSMTTDYKNDNRV